jgi:hypothetical protein
MAQVVALGSRRGIRHTSTSAPLYESANNCSMEHLSGSRMKPEREAEAMKKLPYHGPRRPDGGGAA